MKHSKVFARLATAFCTLALVAGQLSANCLAMDLAISQNSLQMQKN